MSFIMLCQKWAALQVLVAFGAEQGEFTEPWNSTHCSDAHSCLRIIYIILGIYINDSVCRKAIKTSEKVPKDI